jgi:hypothetical protein
MVFVEGEDYRTLRRPGDDPVQFRSVVRPSQLPEPPDSVVHQYRGENFTTSTWPDTASSPSQADMSINGPIADTLNGDKSARADGVDDLTVSTAPAGNGPESLLKNVSFGIAFVANVLAGDLNPYCAVESSTGASLIIQQDDFAGGVVGNVAISLTDDNGDQIRLGSKTNLAGNTLLVAINKRGNTASDFEIYISDMRNEVGIDISTDEQFNNQNVTVDNAMKLFSRSQASSFFTEGRISFFEFNEEPYSPTERQNLKQRAPGL